MPNLRELDALDPFDLKLLSLLESDARLTNAELGEKIGLLPRNAHGGERGLRRKVLSRAITRG